jgi:hypothetical protein
LICLVGLLCFAQSKTKFNALLTFLNARFGPEIEVVGVVDHKSTMTDDHDTLRGRFEITLIQTSELVYSKATRGQDLCASSAERLLLSEKIDVVLKRKRSR